MKGILVHTVDSDYSELCAILAALSLQTSQQNTMPTGANDPHAIIKQLVARTPCDQQLHHKASNPAHICLENDALKCLFDYGLDLNVLFVHLGAEVHFSDIYHTDTSSPESYISRSPLGATLQGVEFHHLLNIARQDFEQQSPVDPILINSSSANPSAVSNKAESIFDHSLKAYSLNNQLSAQRAFCMPSQNPEEIASTIEFGVIIDVVTLLDYLKQILDKAAWLRMYHGRYRPKCVNVVTPNYSAADLGRVIELELLDSSEVVKTDFVFDYCAASRQGVDTEPRLTYAITRVNECLPMQIIKRGSTMLQSIGDQHTTTLAYLGIGEHDRSKVIDAWQSMGCNINPGHPCSIEQYSLPQVNRLWTQNTLAMRELLGPQFIGPSLQHTPCLHALDIWLQHFPSSTVNPALVLAANDCLQHYIDNLFAYLCLPIVDTVVDALPPEQVLPYVKLSQNKLALFKHSGTVYLSEQDPFAQHQWVNTFLAMRIWPEQQDVVALGLSNIRQICERMSQKFSSFATNQPSFHQVIDQQRTGELHAR